MPDPSKYARRACDALRDAFRDNGAESDNTTPETNYYAAIVEQMNNTNNGSPSNGYNAPPSNGYNDYYR